MIKKAFLLLCISLLCSCASKKNIVYFQNIPQNSENVSYESKLKSDDLLTIIISAQDPDAAIPFNLPAFGATGIPGQSIDLATGQMRYQSYLIDSDGNIQFPVIGSLHLAGLTHTEATNKIISELKKYIKDPIVNLRIINFKVTVAGEVARPGEFNIGTERITLPEALGMAGDLTIYGNRKQVLIIREIDGKKNSSFIDLTKGDLINSPYYYLSQNDYIYVEPNKTRINSSVVGPNITVGISAISLLITIIALATR